MMKNRRGFKMITLMLPILVLIILFLQNYIMDFILHLPRCPFYTMFHLYCPGCGNTRSVIALLKGDLFSSLRYNIFPIIIIIYSLCAYIELATYSFGRHLLLLPGKSSFYIVGASLLGGYILIRNFIPFLIP